MATNFWDLPGETRIKLATDATLKGYGVTVPVTTEQSRNNLLRAKVEVDELFSTIRSKTWPGPVSFTNGATVRAATTALQNTPIPAEIITLLAPYFPGYDLSGGSLSNLDSTVSGLQDSINNLVNNPIQLPPQGANVTYNPNNTTPPVGTTQVAPQPVVPVNVTPTATTSPSNTRSEPSTGKILKEAATIAVAAGAASALSDLLRPPKSKKEVTDETRTATPTPEQAVNPETGELYTPVLAKNPSAGNTNRGLSGAIKNTRAQATLQDTTNFNQRKDWRVRLALSPGAQQAKYLYWSDTPGILAPLQATDGVIFPYTPSINVTYGATYNSVVPAHSNYKIFQYESSFVDSINITCDFTAQDTDEANYILAVIHFFRSVTKMFYGQDEFPKPGTPPPLCYLFGLGEFQFNAQPLAVTNFTYNLPTDVDYIRAGALTLPPGSSRASTAGPKKPKTPVFQALGERLAQNAVKKIGGVAGDILSKVIPGGKLAGPNFNGSQNSTGFNSSVPPGTKDPTYVPTKISISISAVPIVSRYEISNNFSVKDYANGKLLNGVKRAGGGFW